MEPSNVNSSRLTENSEPVNDEPVEKGTNIDEVAEDKNDDEQENNATETQTVTCPPPHGDSGNGASESDTGAISEEASMKSKAEEQEVRLSFFSDGPVFPARHNRDLQLSHSGANLSTISSQEGETDNSESSNAMKKSFLTYNDVADDEKLMKKGESLKRPSSALSSCQDSTDFLSNSVVSNSSNLEGLIKKATSVLGETEKESESLAPLSASFFNCQYQTPSWIDDPLIGVPPSAMENKNTHRKTGADMRILTAYMRSLNEMRLPEAIPPAELDKYLSSFFLVVRKADGSEYEPCSLRAMLASIERYLRFKNYPLSLTRDGAFQNMRNVLKLKQQTLRSIGKGQKAPSEVSPSSLAREGKIAHLFKSQEMGPYTPSSVVFTLCFYFCMYLRLRKSTENKKLLWGDIVLCKDDSGREYLTFSSQMLRRTQGSSKLNLRQRSYRVWADPSCPEKDPITIYKFYAQKRPTSMNTNFAPFYLGINVLFPTQGQMWYRPAAMGINKLNEMVRQIRDITGVRSTSDFQGEINIGEKQMAELSSREDQSPVTEIGDRQELEHEVKTEAMDEGEEEDGSSNLAIDFSQEQEPPLDCSQHNELVSTPHPRMMAVGAGSVQAVYSDGENSSDSFSHQSFPVNGDLGHDYRNGKDHDQEIDLTKGSSPDSPLNCSIKGRANFSSSEAMSQKLYSGAGSSEVLSVPEAKQQLLDMVRKMELQDVVEFDDWLKGVKFSTDPVSGQVVCKEREEPMSVKASSVTNSNGANITLNISLTPEALQGDGPITVTAQTSIPTEQQRNSSSSTYGLASKSKPATASKNSSNYLSAVSRHLVSTPPGHSSPDKPLDLATSPVSRNAKLSSSQQAKSNRLHGNNGIFPTSSSTTHLDSPLAKRLRLSAEQAEAYTSASIMASLSSANLVSERLRLQLMQAGLRLGDYSLDAHTAGIMDMANSEALRSQMLQHYGIKSEPK